MAVTQHSVRIVKEMPYRGGTKQFSNRYYLIGESDADWNTVISGIAAAEQECYKDFVSLVAGHHYTPGSDIAADSVLLELNGVLTGTGETGTPGDCAVLLRQATTKRSRLNHPVYCFSYFHGAVVPTGSQPADAVHTAQVSAVQTWGDLLLDGITLDGNVYTRSTPDGHPVTGAFVSGWVHHRDFLN